MSNPEPPRNAPHEAYFRELNRQCAFAVLAYEAMEAALEANKLPPNARELFRAKLHHLVFPALERAHNEVFRSVHSFLTHTANISKLLWPPRPPQTREEALRESLQITDGHPLESRKVRNHLDHYDERLDEWLRESGRGSADLIIAPRKEMEGLRVLTTFRWLDPESKRFYFRGDDVDLWQLREGVIDLQSRVDEALSASGASARSVRLRAMQHPEDFPIGEGIARTHHHDGGTFDEHIDRLPSGEYLAWADHDSNPMKDHSGRSHQLRTAVVQSEDWLDLNLKHRCVGSCSEWRPVRKA